MIDNKEESWSVVQLQPEWVYSVTKMSGHAVPHISDNVFNSDAFKENGRCSCYMYWSKKTQTILTPEIYYSITHWRLLELGEQQLTTIKFNTFLPH